jgi:ribose transport system permease protein
VSDGNQENLLNGVGSSRIKEWLHGHTLRQSGIIWALVLLCIVASIISPNFLKFDNIVNVIRQIAIAGIVSLGMTFVILTGGIDLSVGSIVGAVAVVVASMLSVGLPIPLVLVIGLMIGIVLGGVNGLGITFGKIPPFIMTLGLMVAARGCAMIYSNGSPIGLGKAATSFQWLGGGDVLRIPVPVWIFVLAFVICLVVLKHTPFGRYVFAVGDNREAARLSGTNVKFIECIVYIICGFLSALAAIIFVSRLTVGEPTAGTGLELDAIAMVVIGGTSTFGGQGGVTGTLIGAAIIAVLANLLNLVGISPFIQQIVKGAIIVFAVLLERQQKSEGH